MSEFIPHGACDGGVPTDHQALYDAAMGKSIDAATGVDVADGAGDTVAEHTGDTDDDDGDDDDGDSAGSAGCAYQIELPAGANPRYVPQYDCLCEKSTQVCAFGQQGRLASTCPRSRSPPAF